MMFPEISIDIGCLHGEKATIPPCRLQAADPRHRRGAGDEREVTMGGPRNGWFISGKTPI